MSSAWPCVPGPVATGAKDLTHKKNTRSSAGQRKAILQIGAITGFLRLYYAAEVRGNKFSPLGSPLVSPPSSADPRALGAYSITAHTASLAGVRTKCALFVLHPCHAPFSNRRSRGSARLPDPAAHCFLSRFFYAWREHLIFLLERDGGCLLWVGVPIPWGAPLFGQPGELWVAHGMNRWGAGRIAAGLSL